MMALLNKWVDLPVGAKVILIVAGGGGLMSAAYLLVGNPQVFIVIGIGLAILAALVLGYRWLLKKRKAAKSKPFEQQIASSSGATPREISDPSRRAQLDSIRKKFEEGLRVYRQRGKDLYSLPWYVVIGEPASGKSAAIRNSGVGFPPGLHEEMQGVGGTINMDWFFTNDAVILDTAGRLAFEEVDAAKTSEWKEFLRLLRLSRPRCPINGMLLFIPADSLKGDTADELEQKGSKIARQLDFMQQTLGVRFPLFIIVSKADLLVGFSEFFEGIADPREQFQMFGWSNPASLDEPFQPREVKTVLRSIRDRVVRRRSLLLKEPAPQTLASDRRLDEMDRMFLLPDEVERIAPRLQRYLELIFAGGQWSSPPPFLRGIYFTSALREGEAVDLALAEAVGVEASDVHEDRRWDNKRSFFLHDVFMEKVFRERGLVTAAPSPGRAKRNRRAVLFGAISAILLISIGLSVYSAYNFWKGVKGPEVYWGGVEAALERAQPSKTEPAEIASFRQAAMAAPGTAQTEYWGGEPTGVGDGIPRAKLPAELAGHIKTTPIRASGVFALFDAVSLVPNLDREQWDAQRAVLAASVVNPLLRQSLEHLAAETGDTWLARSDLATPAYAAILDVWTREQGLAPRADDRVEAAPEGGTPPGGSDTGAVRPKLPVRAMGAYVLTNEDDRASFVEHASSMEAALAEAYGPASGGRWPPEGLQIADDLVERATTAFLEHRRVVRAPEARAVITLADRLKAYQDAERGLLQTPWFNGTTSKAAFDTEAARWDGQLRALEQLGDQLDAAMVAVREAGLSLDGSVEDLLSVVATRSAAWASVAIDQALQSLPAVETSEGAAVPAAQTPRAIARMLETRRAELTAAATAQLGGPREQFETGMARSLMSVDGQPKYRWRLAAYRAVGEGLKSGSFAETVSLAELLSAEAGIGARRDGVVETYKQNSSRGGQDLSGGDPLAGVVVAGVRHQRYEIAMRVVGLLASDPAALVERASGEALRLPEISVPGQPLVAELQVDPRYGATGAAQLFGAWRWVAALGVSGAEAEMLAPAEVRTAIEARGESLRRYLGDYVTYWRDTVPRHYWVQAGGFSWSVYHSRLLPNVASRSINTRLADIARVRHEALSAVPEQVYPGNAAELQTTVANARSAYDKCQATPFADLTDRVRGAWSRLPAQPDRARLTLLALQPGEFRNNYLVHETAADRAASLGFWDALIDGMIDSVSLEAGTSLSQQEQRVRADLNSRPFCPDAASVLSADDLSRLVTSIDGLLGAKSGGGEGFAPNTVGAGALTGISAVDNALDRLRTASPSVGEQTRARLASARAIAAWLQKQPEATVRTVGLLQDKPAAEHNTAVLKYVALGTNELDRRATGVAQPLAGKTSLPQSGAVTLSFFDSQSGGSALGTVTLPSPWGVLDLLRNGEPDPSGPSSEPGRDWRVPVRAGSAQVWMGLTFSEPLLVDPKDWPGCAGGD